MSKRGKIIGAVSGLVLAGVLAGGVVVDLSKSPRPAPRCNPVAVTLSLGCPPRFMPPPRIGLL